MFKEFPKVPRLSKDCVISEKLDGTNACVVVTEEGDVFAQSRNRMIKMGDDNYGFARWVGENEQELLKLGMGYHYGEWRGLGVQRGYDMDRKVFSLFVFRGEELPKCCSIVPYLYEGPFDTNKIDEVMGKLKEGGSIASPGFMNPEGIIIYHTASKQIYKKTFEHDEGKRNVSA